MANLERDMKNLIGNLESHEAALKDILYHNIISLDGQYEVWEAYVKDKDT
jgi:hypothetical protein